MRDLLESAPSDRHFVVEIDDDGIARQRFGNGREGEMPDAGMSFAADYWVGNGPAGNVGFETLLTIAFRQLTEVGASSKRAIRWRRPAAQPWNPSPKPGPSRPSPFATCWSAPSRPMTTPPSRPTTPAAAMNGKDDFRLFGACAFSVAFRARDTRPEGGA